LKVPPNAVELGVLDGVTFIENLPEKAVENLEIFVQHSLDVLPAEDIEARVKASLAENYFIKNCSIVHYEFPIPVFGFSCEAETSRNRYLAKQRRFKIIKSALLSPKLA